MLDVDMKVTVDILKRVYESIQDQNDRGDEEIELIDPESHLFVINAFEMPLWHWSQETGTFTKWVKFRIYAIGIEPFKEHRPLPPCQDLPSRVSWPSVID